jgi:predicted dinucleotide-binding enzyme
VNFGILGSGIVGRTLGGKLAELGHQVMIGTRDVSETLARTQPEGYGGPPFGVWQQQHPRVKLGTFADAAAHGEIVVNATAGMGSLEALEMAGRAHLAGKILMDIANPLDSSRGMPPTLSVANADSLGEQIQRAFPETRVVKTLNTVTASLMINPSLLSGEHSVFVSGDDAEAKAMVTQILKDWFGWPSVIDLGDITSARGTEMVMALWLRLFRALQTPLFNYRIVRRAE